MYFRSFEDLAVTIRQNISRIPHDIQVVAGIPRSGIFPAAMIALYKNVLLTDIDGLLEGRYMSAGENRAWTLAQRVGDKKNVLIVDDSISSGKSLKNIKRKLSALSDDYNITYCAIYGAKSQYSEVDIVMDVVPLPRTFEWNFLHNGPALIDACLDIDGVLCFDPLDVDNDDGERYLSFLEGAAPHLLPTVKVGSIVSSRLEKYRPQTEVWLKKHGIEWGELHLLDGVTAEERRQGRMHAKFKAQVYSSKPDSWLFIESDAAQAHEIAKLSGKSVLSIEDMTLYEQTSMRRVQQKVGRLHDRLKRGFARLIGKQVRFRGDRPLI